MKIFLVRHLATSFNKTGVYMGRGRDDAPVLEADKKLFEEKISNQQKMFKNLGAIYSSPAKRCFDTAEIVKGKLRLNSQIEISDDLLDTDIGDFAGKNMAEIKETYPKYFDTWVNSPSELEFPNGESYENVNKRSIRFLQEIVSKAGDKPKDILIVSHADIIKVILCYALGTSFDNKKYLVINESSVSCIEQFSKRFRVTFLNL